MSRKIMVVDDNKEFLEELKEILVLSGYEVVDVNESVKVVNVAAQTKPDVILLDLKMPEKSGLRVAYELKHFSELSHIPIIAMTGFLNEVHFLFLDVCGIKKCLKKPFNPLDAIYQIEQALVEH
jgi:CheY-like chemotaxis protein